MLYVKRNKMDVIVASICLFFRSTVIQTDTTCSRLYSFLVVDCKGRERIELERKIFI